MTTNARLAAGAEAADETLELLGKGAADFLAARQSGRRIRQLRDTPIGYERAMWRDMAGLGWLAVRFDEAAGGLGLDCRQVAALAGEMGRSLLPEPWIACALMPAVLLQGADDSALRSQLIEGVIAGDSVLTVAWQEEADQLDAGAALAMELRATAAGYSLHGAKRFVPAVAGADGLLVSARLRGEVVLVHVPLSAPGITVTGQRLVDGSHGADLQFAAVPVARTALLARGAAAERLLTRMLLEAGAAICAWQTGLAARALDMTVDYLKTRVQFGRVLASFQALQHRAVDLAIQVRRAEAALRRATALLDDADTAAADRAAALHAARACCADMSLQVTRACIQLHGGIGFTDEADIGLYLRTALRLAGWLGSGDAHQRRFLQLREAAPATAAAGAAVPATALPVVPLGEDGRPDYNAMSDADFRAVFRAWLKDNLPADYKRPADRLLGAPAVDWMQRLTRGGWRAPGWPVEFGGLALSIPKHAIYHEEMDRSGAARWIDHGVWSLGDILMRYGTPEQKAHYLPRILSCEHVWAQGYSEPNAGSDLASLRTRAVREGSEWVVNGQKIWTSGAAHATHIFLLVRTNPDVAKQRGISFLLVDLKTPGITIRPILNLADELEFCEVFFQDVRVPAENLVGQVDQGWSVAKGLLGMERLAISSSSLPRRALAALRAVGRQRGIIEDPDFRRRHARLLLEIEVHDALYDQTCDGLEAGRDVSADLSILRIMAGELVQRVSEAAMECAAEYGPIGTVRVDGVEHDIKKLFMIARPATIYGGTAEIQRNILAKHLLGMPDK